MDDMAAASVHVMNLPKATYDQHTSPMQSHINVGYLFLSVSLGHARCLCCTIGL